MIHGHTKVAAIPIDGFKQSTSPRGVDNRQGSDNSFVRTPIPSHIDLAGNTSYHFAASRTVSHGCRLTMARERLRLLAHVYDSVASIHMTENRADMASREPKAAQTYGDRHT